MDTQQDANGTTTCWQVVLAAPHMLRTRCVSQQARPCSSGLVWLKCHMRGNTRVKALSCVDRECECIRSVTTSKYCGQPLTCFTSDTLASRLGLARKEECYAA